MGDIKQNMIDRFIEAFSTADLKKRAWFVTFLGVFVCLAVITALYFFLNWKFRITPESLPTPFWKMLWMGH